MNLLHTIGLMTRAEHERLTDELDNDAFASWNKAITDRDDMRMQRDDWQAKHASVCTKLNEMTAKFNHAATDLAAQAEEIAALSAAFPADVLAVMNQMSDFLSFTSEQIAADATSESGIQITPTRVTAIRKALHTLGLAGFGTLHDEDSERVMGRGYWLTGEGVDVRRTLNQAADRKRMAGKRGKA